MAVTHSTASGVKKGKVGNTTYYYAGGRQLSRAAYNSSNYGDAASRSYRQQQWRVRWANVVNFYKNSQGWMFYAFEGKKKNQSDYNKFVSLNVGASNFFLTKQEAASGGCIASNYLVSEGSLFPISMTLQNGIFVTNIATTLNGDFTATTIAELSADLIACNSWLSEGCQISFISYQQYVDSNNVPRVICTPYELTLDISSQAIVSDYLPTFCFRGNGQFIVTGNNVSPGAHCFVLSKTTDGKTTVSTQRLVVYQNEALIAEYSSSGQLELAILSYGVDDTKFLESGSEETTTTAQPIAVNSVTINGESWNGKTTGFAVSLSASATIVLTCAGDVDQASDISLFCYNGQYVNIILIPTSGGNGYSVTVNGNIVTFTVDAWQVLSGYSGTATSFYLWKIEFTGGENDNTYSFGASSASALGYEYDGNDDPTD